MPKANAQLRHDHTDWVTHFVRDRNPDQDFPGQDEDEFGFFAGGELDAGATAFEVLQTIIRLGGITPGYSFRNGRTTIYGGNPAVCATEMPLYSFATYAKKTANTSKVSAYGISFRKDEFFAAGGRPAIYGLSKGSASYVINHATRRILAEDVLPRHEQFRYVAHNPSGQTVWIDWSHEREWRWIPRSPDEDQIWVQDYNGIYGPTPALPIFKGKLDGRPFSRVCVIVWTQEEAELIKEMLTGFYLAGSNNYGTPFDRELIAASKIIVLQDVINAVEHGKDVNAQTIEGLAQANLLNSIEIKSPPPDVEKIIDIAMGAAGEAVLDAAKAFKAEHGAGSGYCGFAHAVTYDVTNAIVQHLLATNRASGPFDGRVWIGFPHSGGSQEMDYNEAIATAAAKALSKHLGISVYMESNPD
jgi:hypothetical protein